MICLDVMKYRQILWNTFHGRGVGSHGIPSNVITYHSIHSTFRYLHTSSNIFEYLHMRSCQQKNNENQRFVKYRSQTNVNKDNKYSQFPVNIFKFPPRCSDIRKYHQMLWNTFQYIKSLDIFTYLQIPCLGGVFDKDVAWRGHMTEASTHITLMKSGHSWSTV